MAAILRTEKLCKYFGGVKAVNKVDLEVEKGKIFGIIGPNGAGKTTFFNVLTGLLPPTEGKIFFAEQNISTLQAQNITNMGIARTFQNIKLFDHLTVHDNVKIGFHTKTKTGFIDAFLKNSTFRQDEEMVDREGRKILARVGLGGQEETLAENLSYGDKRRLEIARALAANPKLLLVDEPTAGMNPKESEKVVELLTQLNDEGITIIIIEHDMSVIMNMCDEIAVLNKGKVISQGTAEEVQQDPVVLEAYLGVS